MTLRVNYINSENFAAADINATNAEVNAKTTNSSDATLLARANHTGTQLASTISDLAEAVQDILAAALVEGANVDLTYNDPAGTLTVAATGGGGGLSLTDDGTGLFTVGSSGTATLTDDGTGLFTIG